MSWVLLNTLLWPGVCLALLAGAAELGEKMDVWTLETQSVPFQGSSGTVKLSYICRAMHTRSLPCSFPVMAVLCSAGLRDW